MPTTRGKTRIKEATLRVEGVVKDFIGLRALDNVTMELHRGEILGLIGPNGSGKSTLVNVITGILAPTKGRVLIDGKDLTGLPVHHIARSGVARTYQTIRLFSDLTVVENVEVAAVGVGHPRRKAHAIAVEILEELGLESWKDEPVGALPYGYERAVEIARALAMQPKFLLLDEPAAGLNEEEGDELLEKLRAIPEGRGLGMLIIDHDMRLIMRLCDRLHVLNFGKTIGEGTPEEVRRIPAVVEAYLRSSNGEDR